jgi:hypothetical protein
VQRRAEAKDYIDIDAMLSRQVINLASALAAALAKYGPTFNPQLSLKALCFFDEGDLQSLPQAVKKRLVGAVRSVDLDNLPPIPPRDD